MQNKQMTDSTKAPQAPPGYKHHKHLFGDWETTQKFPFWLLIIWANFIALIPLGLGVLFLWLPYQLYRMVGSPFAFFPDMRFSLPVMIGSGIIIIGGSMFLHEWLHGTALTLLGYKPRYSFNKYYLLATIQDGTFLTRKHYLQMTLTPIIVMTLAGSLLLPFIPPVLGQIVLIAVLLNMAASLGDLMVALRVYKTPREAKFADDRGIQVFLPESSTPQKSGAI